MKPTTKGLGSTGRLFNERRSTNRGRAQAPAVVRFGAATRVIGCTARNVSAGGARLSFKEAVTVPARIEVRIGSDRAWRTASVAWRRGQEVGIRFA